MNDVSTRRLLWLLRETRGGPARVRLLRLLTERPMNANRLSKELGMDYTTVRHHLDVLEGSGVLEAVGDRYGTVYCVSGRLADKEALARILEETGKK